MNNLKNNNMIIVSGWMMILFSIAFTSITLIIDQIGQSHPLLYGMEQHSLFKVAAGTPVINALLVIYGLSPLLLIPGFVSSYYLLREQGRICMRTGLYFAIIGTLSLSLSMLMLPSLNWHVVTYIQTLNATQQPIMIIMLQALHSYIGLLIGDLLGFGCIIVWAIITSIKIIKTNFIPQIFGFIQLFIALFAFIILFLRFTGLSPNIYINLQLPAVIALWFFIHGISMISFKKENL